MLWPGVLVVMISANIVTVELINGDKKKRAADRLKITVCCSLCFKV